MKQSSSNIASNYPLSMMWLICSVLAILITSGLLIWVQLLLERKVTMSEFIVIDLSFLIFNGLAIYLFARYNKRILATRTIETNVDISALKQSESRLRKIEKYQRAFIDSLPFMVWIKDEESRFISVNTVLAKSFGEDKPENLIGKTDFDYSSKELAEYYRQEDLSVLQSKQPKFVDETFVDAQGKTRWIETFKAPAIDNDGNLLGTVGFARDISERKITENELKVSAIAMESQEGIIITDANSKILKINDAFTKITGFTSEEAVGNRMTLLKSRS